MEYSSIFTTASERRCELLSDVLSSIFTILVRCAKSSPAVHPISSCRDSCCFTDRHQLSERKTAAASGTDISCHRERQLLLQGQTPAVRVKDSCCFRDRHQLSERERQLLLQGHTPRLPERKTAAASGTDQLPETVYIKCKIHINVSTSAAAETKSHCL